MDTNLSPPCRAAPAYPAFTSSQSCFAVTLPVTPSCLAYHWDDVPLNPGKHFENIHRRWSRLAPDRHEERHGRARSLHCPRICIQLCDGNPALYCYRKPCILLALFDAHDFTFTPQVNGPSSHLSF